MVDRYGRDVLRQDPHRKPTQKFPEVPAANGLVVECRYSGFCGAVVGIDRDIEGYVVELEDRQGKRRAFVMRAAAFLIDGSPVSLVRPSAAPKPSGPIRSNSGSTFVRGHAAQVAKASRIWVEGIHDAELIEKVWGHDLRVEGIVVEPLHGADHLVELLHKFGPRPDRRVGVLLDHMVSGSKEHRLAEAAMAEFNDVLVIGHPYVDVWQAVRPDVIGISTWPQIPKGVPWKAGVIAALGWPTDEREAWQRILGKVRTYIDLEPAMLGRVEELIDFVTVM